MKRSINLLQEAQSIQLKLKRMGLLVQTASLVILGVFGALVAILLSYTLFLNRQHKKLVERISEQEKIVEDLRAAESKQLVIKQKLGLAKKIVDEPSLPYKLLNQAYLLASDSAEVVSAEASKGDQTVVFTVNIADVFALVGFMDELVDFSKENPVLKLVSNSVVRSQDLSYRFEFSLKVEE